jgi:GT2 family glycosyltransferase
VNQNAGIVVIGRNEGERLRRCFDSICDLGSPVVYVDSNSSDESVKIARDFNLEVVELDARSVGRSRARNEGFNRLLQLNPGVRFVQFLDGDCEIVSDWISIAAQNLQAAPEVAIVCGRLRERSPQASIYNRLCEIEWDQPVGETTRCSGNCMMRVSAFLSVGGFDPTVLAAEDDEICLRLRRRSWKIVRLEAQMATHDAAMTRLEQWWRRSVRSGYAYAQGASMHGASAERHFARETARAWFWAFLLPLAAVGAAWPSRGLSLFLLLLYGGLFSRIYFRSRRRNLSRTDAAAYAGACLISKFAEFVGLIKFYRTQLRGTPMRLIEHR